MTQVTADGRILSCSGILDMCLVASASETIGETVVDEGHPATAKADTSGTGADEVDEMRAEIEADVNTAARIADAAEVLDDVVGHAESQLMLVDPGDGAGWAWPAELAAQVTSAARRGLRVRVLFGRWPSDTFARHFARHAAGAGAEIRTGSAPDQAMLTVDGRAAVLASEHRSVALVTQPEAVRMLCGFGNLAWSGGAAITVPAPAALERRDVDSVHRSMQQRIVALLADGAKDETIARALGMSVRTCRRHIADIMHRLDAVSRFQAGANAVRLGLAGIEPAPRP